MVTLRAYLFIFVFFGACHSPAKRPNGPQRDSPRRLAKQGEAIKKLKQPVFGYRFVIVGDFDGDGRKEKLVEHYYSGLQHRETNKFYDSLDDYGQLVEAASAEKTVSFVTSDNTHIATLPISTEGQSFGLAYLKNEGDLDGDGTDEVSYVTNWADWSNLNTWHIMTYKNNRWRELYHFSIWDWQLPDLPGVINDYSLFGRQNEIVHTAQDSTNKQLELTLADFQGLVKKLGKNKIQIFYMNEDAMLDTAIVNLKNKKRSTFHPR